MQINTARSQLNPTQSPSYQRLQPKLRPGLDKKRGNMPVHLAMMIAALFQSWRPPITVAWLAQRAHRPDENANPIQAILTGCKWHTSYLKRQTVNIADGQFRSFLEPCL